MRRLMSALLLIVLVVGGVGSIASGCTTMYTITYHLEGYNAEESTDKPTPTKYKLSGSPTLLWDPVVPDKHSFKGWYDNAEYTGMSMGEIPAKTKGNIELYGRFVADSYSITYYIDGEEITNAVPKQYTRKNNNKAVGLYQPEKIDGKYFEGWFEKSDFTGEEVSQILGTDVGNKTYYGRYVVGEVVEYGLTFFVGGVEQTGASMTSYRESINPRPLWMPEYDTAVNGFDGWYLNADFTGTKYPSIPANTTGDKIYYGRLIEPNGYGQAMGRKKSYDFTLKEVGNNEEVTLSDFYGIKPVVLNFWSSKCDPCKLEMPHFQKVYAEIGTTVEFMMINSLALKDTPTDAAKYISDNGFTFPYFIDANHQVATTYNVSSIPVTVIVDKWGYISYSFRGTISEATLRSEIQKAFVTSPN